MYDRRDFREIEDLSDDELMALVEDHIMQDPPPPWIPKLLAALKETAPASDPEELEPAS